MSVKSAPTKTKKGKASGTPGAVIKILLASGDPDLERMANFFKCMLSEKRLPTDWNTSITLNCFNYKKEVTERGRTIEGRNC